MGEIFYYLGPIYIKYKTKYVVYMAITLPFNILQKLYIYLTYVRLG
jgi:hypothetical protein